MSDTITITSKMGRFEFDKKVLLSKAKAVRDAVLGEYFNPKVSGSRIKTVEDCYAYAEMHLDRELSDIPFTLDLTVKQNDGSQSR